MRKLLISLHILLKFFEKL